MTKKYFLRTGLFCLVNLVITFGLQAQVSCSANVNSGCHPLAVNFTGNGGSGATSYSWNFNDGSTTVTTQNPSHVFVKPGYYSVSFSAFNTNGGFLGNAYTNINVSGVSDSIFVSEPQICPTDISGFSIQYTGNAPTSITWNFGDGYITTNSYNGTQHSYAALGTYTITAIATTACGKDTTHGIVHVINNAPFKNPPQFSVQADSICPGDAAVFWVDYYHQNYQVDYGDGTSISHTPNPNNGNTQLTHVYTAAGTYPAKVTYYNACGNSISVVDTIHVVPNHRVSGYVSIDANYGQHRDTACINSYVQLYPNGNGFHTYLWNFGGGATDTSTLSTPIHKFTTLGKFVVTLTVTNGCGNTKKVMDTLKIVNNLPFGGLNVSVTPVSICPGQSILYNGSSQSSNSNDPSLTYLWKFGDNTTATGNQGTHTLSVAGTYSVTCIGQNSCGSKDSLTKVVVVSNSAIPVKADYRLGTTASGRAACPGDSIIFIFAPAGSGTVHWDFGDTKSGNATQDLIFQNTDYRYIKHAYQFNGHYTATVTYTNSCGNSFSDTLGLDINAHSSDFGSGNGNMLLYDNTVYPCQGRPIPFYGLEGSTYIWNFGDGTGELVTHQSLSPVYHAFQDAGKFTVTLRVYNACGNTATDTVNVNIPASYLNITTNSVNSHCHLSNGKAIAVVKGGTAPYTYQWSNGKTKYLDDSLAAGIYVIHVTDIHGCTNDHIATVNDAEAPTITVNTVINVSCFGGSDGAIALNLIGGSGPFTYHWSTGATTQSINNQVAGPKEITVTDVNGCTASKSINIGESPPVQVSTVSHPASCNGSNGSVTAAVNGTTGPYNYNWSNSVTTASNSGLTPGVYSVTVVDNNGCLFNAEATVSNIGGPVIYQDSITGTGCGANVSKIYTHAAGGSAPYTYSWSNGLTTPNLTNGGVGNYVLTVKGSNGCETIQDFVVSHDLPSGNAICMVTVDSATNTNQVVWEKQTSTAIARYMIYKESSKNGLYYLVDSVPYHSLSQWTDPISDPRVRSWKYKISVMDNCGDESTVCGEHKTIHLNANLGLGGVYNLIWDEYIGFAYSTFLIYRYTPTGGWQQIASVPSNVLSYTDATPPPNTYSYRVDAVPTFICNPTARVNPTGQAAINTTHSNIKTVDVTVTGMPVVILSEQFNMYPNPSNGSIQVNYPQSNSGYRLVVFNAVGQMVFGKDISKEDANGSVNSLSLDLSSLPKGVYIVTLDNHTSLVHKKLILN
jgi:PKD repeat protein